MYSRQEATQLKKEFWKVFGQYMSPIPSSEGEKINWINYKTGVKGFYFRIDVTQETATIAIELVHPLKEKRQYFFNQLLALKNQFDQILQEEWTWREEVRDENQKTISRIYKQKEGVSILRKEDWPALISFFKPRMIALDEFWNLVKYGFEGWQ